MKNFLPVKGSSIDFRFQVILVILILYLKMHKSTLLNFDPLFGISRNSDFHILTSYLFMDFLNLIQILTKL
ncbi:unnamed protein product [Blepharisma stoltei]|uniref:Uncharacterized protein n=1 Tax=Blepharisma stoltei TaxID=1481888 RepID=A0AAU9J4M3_9CILI|nr:unnamed protein product [Blepharisma stoltei]